MKSGSEAHSKQRSDLFSDVLATLIVMASPGTYAYRPADGNGRSMSADRARCKELTSPTSQALGVDWSHIRK